MAINSIRISGKVVCDYIWYLNRKLTTQEKEFVSDRKNEPSWNLDTGILVTFNESLVTLQTEATCRPLGEYTAEMSKMVLWLLHL